MTDDRAAATTLGYTLTIGIALTLVTILLLGGGVFVEERREDTARAELEIVGQQVASTITRADRLAATTDGAGTVSIEQRLPETVAGSRYDINVTGDGQLVLDATSNDVTVEVNVTTNTDLRADTIEGGGIRVAYDTAADELVVRPRD